MTFRVGCGAGFSGDRIDAAIPVVASLVAAGGPAALVFETLAERTLALGHVARRGDADAGFEPLLDAFLAPVLAPCVGAGIVVVGNFGAANPGAAARRVRDLAVAAGLPRLRIAIIEGDDVLSGLDVAALRALPGDTQELDADLRPLSANAYLGARPIAEAIAGGADVVVTGRVADPALVLGPLAAHYGWAWDDWDRLAAGTLVGHLLECGAQVTGGYFADPGLKDVPALWDVGFPIAEVDADGSCVVTKPAGTGGLVDVRTVKEQLLYEIHDPNAYLTPDVVLDLGDVEVAAVGSDRVAVRGAKGRPAPDCLKVTLGIAGDWLGEAEISYAGPNARARAELAAEVVERRLAKRELALRRRFDLIGTVAAFDGDAGALRRTSIATPDEVRLRLAVAGPDRRPVEAALQEVLALYCCGPAGGGGVRSRTQQRITTVAGLLPRSLVTPRVRWLEEDA